MTSARYACTCNKFDCESCLAREAWPQVFHVEHAEAPSKLRATLTPQERQAVILCMLLRTSQGGRNPAFADTLSGDMIEEYLDVTGLDATHVMIIGPNKSNEFRSDLKTLFDRGILRRYRSGCSDMPCGGGWPKWVWAYSLEPGMVEAAKREADWFNASHPERAVKWDYSKG